MGKIALIAFAVALMAAVASEELSAEGRQMNWNNFNFATKPGYSQSYLPSSSEGDMNDLNGSASMLSAQSRVSGSFQSLPSQSLDGQDISREGSSSYGSNSDYGYEASPDTSYGNAVGYGYDYQRNLPTPSGPFYSNPSITGNSIPNSFLRGMPREQANYPILTYPNLPNSRVPYQNQQSNVSKYNGSGGNFDLMLNRAGYDEDAPLGGISSLGSTGSMLSGTNMRNSISRYDDLSYGTVNGGYSSIPPAVTGYSYGGGYGTGYGNGVGYGTGYAYGGGYGGGSYASPGYSSNRIPYGAYSNYGSPSYSYAGYSGNYGYSPYSTGYTPYGGGYRSPLYAGYEGGYYGLQPAYFKKPKKAFHDWLKYGGDVIPYGYGSGYGYGSNYATVPYDYYYDPPSIWYLSKFAMKSIIKSMFKPILKWLPFCSPFFYARSDRSDDRQSNFVSALTAFLPIGLFLAAIVPNIVTISGRRKRSESEEAHAAREEATFPILDMINSFGVRSLQEPSCQSKIVCEIGRMGGFPEANVVQRALWITANYVPERVSSIVGADKLFRQIRSQQCSEFMCSSE